VLAAFDCKRDAHRAARQYARCAHGDLATLDSAAMSSSAKGNPGHRPEGWDRGYTRDRGGGGMLARTPQTAESEACSQRYRNRVNPRRQGSGPDLLGNWAWRGWRSGPYSQGSEQGPRYPPCVTGEYIRSRTLVPVAHKTRFAIGSYPVIPNVINRASRRQQPTNNALKRIKNGPRAVKPGAASIGPMPVPCDALCRANRSRQPVRSDRAAASGHARPTWLRS